MLSVMMFAYQSEQTLEASCRIVLTALTEANIPHELIIIDDGSTDRSFEVAERLEREHERVRAFRLSRNFTTPNAQFAGLSVCSGQCATFVPDDLQRPIEVVIEMYRQWEQGHKLIISHRRSRDDGTLRDILSGLYYRIMNALSEIQFPPGGTDGFLADREIIGILNKQISPRNTSSVIEVLRLGFDPVYVAYDRPQVDGKSRWTFKKRIRLAKDTFFAASSFPIKFITWVGLLSFAFSFILIVLITFGKVFSSDRLFGYSVPGWTSIVVFISFFSGLILFSLGIIAEYIWRTMEEVKRRPAYIIREKDTEVPPADATNGQSTDMRGDGSECQ